MSEQPVIDVTTLPVVQQQQNTSITRAQDNAMGVADVLAQVRLVQEVMTKVMIANEHFGKIPGCGDKMTLLQPGAQKLCMTFRLAPEYQIQETNYDRGHKEYRVICTLKSIASGNFVGQGVGCCSTLESKYRWKGGARKCPECKQEAIIKGKSEFGGGWLCWQKKGGCGAKWPDGAVEIEGQNVDKVEHDSPADFYNTVLKMAKKRAFVDATITATAASDIFTQDIGDDDGNGGAPEPPKTPQDTPRRAAPSSPASAKKAAAAPQGATATPQGTKQGTEAKLDIPTFLANCRARLLSLVNPDDEWAWWRYAIDKGWIMSNESLADATAEKMFEGYDPGRPRESISDIFGRHDSAIDAMAANTPPEMKEEILRGLVLMPRPKAKEPAKPKGITCPACSSTATKKHDDLEGVLWCQKCGVQWQAADPNKEPYEAHEWMFAKLPFAPKDAAKKDYKGKTLGQLSRLDSKYWYGIVINFKAEPFQGRPPSAESIAFGEACEAARKHLKQTADKENPSDEEPGEEDDVPF